MDRWEDRRIDTEMSLDGLNHEEELQYWHEKGYVANWETYWVIYFSPFLFLYFKGPTSLYTPSGSSSFLLGEMLECSFLPQKLAKLLAQLIANY